MTGAPESPPATPELLPTTPEPLAIALARYYDLDLSDEPGDVEMHLALAGSVEGDILELMAGSGRVAVPLAASGRRVVAIDHAPAMLARAATLWSRVADRAAGAQLELVEADAVRLTLDEQFGLVLVALNSLLLVDHDTQPELFVTIARHLAPGGRAVVDTWLPRPEDLALYDGRQILDWVRHDDETDELVAKTSAARYDSAWRVADVTTFFDAWRETAADAPVRRSMRRDRASFSDARRIVDMAVRAGLEIDVLAGDYDMSPFGADADRAVLVCRSPTG